MSLEQLMNVDVTVASQMPMNNRESPGIVTIFNQEDIISTGATDLIGLLQQVPGFDFGVDVDGVVGIGVRGNWANEGKVLLLWDGMEMNEDLYSTLQFGSHYPLEMIHKIEIIRGPGSAMYGGYAEYAVINIMTVNQKNFNGVTATVFGSQMTETFANRGIAFAAGKTFGKAHINLSSSLNGSNRSEEMYVDGDGNSYDMTDQSRLANRQYRADFYLGGLSLTAMYDNYSLQQRDGYSSIYNQPYTTQFNSLFLNGKFEHRLNEQWSVTPGFRMKMQEPWSYNKEVLNDDYSPFYTSVNKHEYFVNTSYDPDERINISGGLIYYHQLAHENLDSVYFNNASKELGMNTYAGFAQGIFRLKPLNIILGSRYEYNTTYGPSFVPRLGITRVWEKFHVKALFSRAFRSPSIMNVNLNPDILPENTTVVELEGGVNLSSHCYLTANLYDITTEDPIIYYYDVNEQDQYINERTIGSRGFEIDFKTKLPVWMISIAYSFSTTAGHNTIDIYEVPGMEKKLLGLPTHEVSINSTYQATKKLGIAPSFNLLSERYYYILNSDGTQGAGKLDPSLYANLNFNFKDFLCNGLMLQVGCNNITNEKSWFVQPYNGNHRPLPGQGRLFQLKLKYNISFKN